MGHQERTCMHLHGDEQPAGGAYPARERRKIQLLTTRLEEGAEYEVQQGFEVVRRRAWSTCQDSTSRRLWR